MASITISIPDAQLPRVVAAYGTQANLKTDLIAHIKSKVAQSEQQAAVSDIDQDVNESLDIT